MEMEMWMKTEMEMEMWMETEIEMEMWIGDNDRDGDADGFPLLVSRFH